jgi:hypothetical protein
VDNGAAFAEKQKRPTHCWAALNPFGLFCEAVIWLDAYGRASFISRFLLGLHPQSASDITSPLVVGRPVSPAIRALVTCSGLSCKPVGHDL